MALFKFLMHATWTTACRLVQTARQQLHGDIGISLLSKTVHKISYDLLKLEPSNEKVAFMFGRRVVFTADPASAKHVFQSNEKNYTQRIGCDAGLKALGMLEEGIIWNNDTPTWRAKRNFGSSRTHLGESL